MTKQNKLTFIILVMSAVVIVIGALLLLPKDQPDGKKPDNGKDIVSNTASEDLAKQRAESARQWQAVDKNIRLDWLKNKLNELNQPNKQKATDQLLANLPPDSAQGLLILSSDAKYQSSANRYLDKLSKTPEGKNALLDSLKSENRDELKNALRVLSYAPDDRFKDELIKLLGSSKTEVVDEALLIAQTDRMRDERIVDALLKLFSTYDDSRNYLVLALGAQKNDRAVEPLTERLRTYQQKDDNHSMEKVGNIIMALGSIGNPRSIEAILAAIPADKPDSNVPDVVTSLAINALGEIAEKQPDKMKAFPPNVLEGALKILESDKFNLYPDVNSLLSKITGKTVELKSGATREEAAKAAQEWRKILSGVTKKD